MTSTTASDSLLEGRSLESTIRGVIGAAVVLTGLVTGITMWRYAATLPVGFETVLMDVRMAPRSDAERGISRLGLLFVPMMVCGLWALFGVLSTDHHEDSLKGARWWKPPLAAAIPGFLTGPGLLIAWITFRQPVQVHLAPLSVAVVGTVAIGFGLASSGTPWRTAFRGAGLSVVCMVLSMPLAAIAAVPFVGAGSIWLMAIVFAGVLGALLSTAGRGLYRRGSRSMARHPRTKLVGEWLIALLGLALAMNLMLNAWGFAPYQEMVEVYNASLVKQGWDPVPIPERP